MPLSTGKTVQILFDQTLDTYEEQTQLINLTSFEQPDPGALQNAGNSIWRPVEMNAPILEGWDLDGQETEVIEETYPAILGTPKNDFVQLRADDMRDRSFWEKRGRASGRRQASELNKQIASAVATQGSMFVRSNTASGYDFLAEGQAIQNERQQEDTGRCYVLNDRDTLKFSSDLAGRQTLQGRPADTWSTGQIGSNVAEYDVYTGSYLPTLAGGADPATTVTGAQSFKPEGGTADNATGIVTNVDYRIATIPVADSSAYNIGDKVSLGNLQSLGLGDKTETGQLMTFTIVAKPTGTSLSFYPKPIAADDAALTEVEKAAANVNTTIPNGAEVNRLNIDASAKTNLFWDKSAVEVLGGTIPAELFKQYSGMQSVHHTLENGLTMYMVYDGQVANLSFRYRLFTWYGITIANPSACGVGVTF